MRHLFQQISVVTLLLVGASAAGSSSARADESRWTPQGAEQTYAQAVRQLHNFRFVEYPELVRQLQEDRQRLEAEAYVAASRVNSYRPMRSFGQYSPTWTAEQNWRLESLAASQRLRRLQQRELDLSRYKRAKLRQLRYHVQVAAADLASAFPK